MNRSLDSGNARPGNARLDIEALETRLLLSASRGNFDHFGHTDHAPSEQHEVRVHQAADSANGAVGSPGRSIGQQTARQGARNARIVNDADQQIGRRATAQGPDSAVSSPASGISRFSHQAKRAGDRQQDTQSGSDRGVDRLQMHAARQTSQSSRRLERSDRTIPTPTVTPTPTPTVTPTVTVSTTPATLAPDYFGGTRSDGRPAVLHASHQPAPTASGDNALTNAVPDSATSSNSALEISSDHGTSSSPVSQSAFRSTSFAVSINLPSSTASPSDAGEVEERLVNRPRIASSAAASAFAASNIDLFFAGATEAATSSASTAEAISDFLANSQSDSALADATSGLSDNWNVESLAGLQRAGVSVKTDPATQEGLIDLDFHLLSPNAQTADSGEDLRLGREAVKQLIQTMQQTDTDPVQDNQADLQGGLDCLVELNNRSGRFSIPLAAALQPVQSMEMVLGLHRALESLGIGGVEESDGIRSAILSILNLGDDSVDSDSPTGESWRLIGPIAVASLAFHRYRRRCQKQGALGLAETLANNKPNPQSRDHQGREL